MFKDSYIFIHFEMLNTKIKESQIVNIGQVLWEQLKIMLVESKFNPAILFIINNYNYSGTH